MPHPRHFLCILLFASEILCIADPLIKKASGKSKITINEDEISNYIPLVSCPPLFEHPSSSCRSSTSDEEELPQQTEEQAHLKSGIRRLSENVEDYDVSTQEKVDLNELLQEIFLTNGRLLPYERILCWFPNYLKHFFTSMNQIMNGENCLPTSWRYYLSIMVLHFLILKAVSCFKNEYLLKVQEEQFLLNGGSAEWIRNGMEKIPEKLKKIAQINEILAHKPWTLNYQHIQVSWLSNIRNL